MRFVCLSLLVSLLSLSLLLVPDVVSAASSGSLGYCDINAPAGYGAGSPGKVMYWAQPPRYNPVYTVRSGDDLDSTKDPRSYRPGVLQPIHVRVTDFRMLYLGLVMYATDSNGKQVGNWSVPTHLIDYFQTPPNCQGKAVSHRGARQKPIHSMFYYQAPPAGTGNITFQVMIKQGEQNKGAFFWPTKKLILTERPDPNPVGFVPSVMMVRSAVGQSCKTACAATGKYPTCYRTAQASLNSTTALWNLVSQRLSCPLPLLSSCAPSSPSVKDGYCYYADNERNCAATGRVPVSPDLHYCSTVVLGGSQRLCICAKQTPAALDPATLGFANGAVGFYDLDQELQAAQMAALAAAGAPRSSSSSSSSTGRAASRSSSSSSSSSTGGRAASSSSSSSTGAVAGATVVTLSTPVSRAAVDIQPTVDVEGSTQRTSSAAGARSAPAAIVNVMVAAMCAYLAVSLPAVASLLSVFSPSRLGFSFRFPSVICVVSVSCLFLLSFSPSRVLSHNWLDNQGRGLYASTYFPCPPRMTDQPNLQVGINQEFEVAWSTGHSGRLFFMILPSSQFHQLYNIKTDFFFTDYIANAPPEAHYENVPRYQRTHITQFPSNSNEDSFYTSGTPINQNHSAYIPIDPVLRPMFKTYQPTATLYEYQYKNETLKEDARVSYQSAKYPWIDSVHMFWIPAANAVASDIARFKITPRQGPGDYIFFYKWAGYSDCIDINVRPEPVVHRYGKVNATNPLSVRWKRIDHCEFTWVREVATTCRLITMNTTNTNTALEQCQKDCAAKSHNACPNVQAVRVKNLPAPKVFPQVENIPYKTIGFPPCDESSVAERIADGCTAAPLSSHPGCSASSTAKAGPDDYVCYGLSPWLPNDLKATDNHQIVDDPADPRFYSTCWFRDEDRGFVTGGLPPQPPVLQSWRVYDQCLSCPFVNKVNDAITRGDSKTVFNWAAGVTNICANCDNLKA